MKNEKLFMILAYPIIIFVGLIAVLFALAPGLLYAFPQIHRFFIASSFVIESPTGSAQQAGGKLLLGQTFYISAGSSTVSVLHIVPKEERGNPHLEVLRKPEYKIIMYFHQVPRNNNFESFCNALVEERKNVQIVSFDYKGFGDAAGETTKSGAIEDARTVYGWVRRHAPKSKIHFWGHALGAGIAAAALEEILNDGDDVESIVLEAPFFDTLTMLHRRFFAVKLYSHLLPERFFTSSLDVIDLNFNTTRSIARVDVPTLILNGEHDTFAKPDQVRKLVADVRRHRDFVFHVEWRCPKVKHSPAQEANSKELGKIIERFHFAADLFWVEMKVEQLAS